MCITRMLMTSFLPGFIVRAPPKPRNFPDVQTASHPVIRSALRQHKRVRLLLAA